MTVQKGLKSALENLQKNHGRDSAFVYNLNTKLKEKIEGHQITSRASMF